MSGTDMAVNRNTLSALPYIYKIKHAQLRGRADVKVLGENNIIWEKGCTSLRDVLLIMGSSQGAKSNSGGLIANKIVYYIHSIISDTYRELVGSFVTLPLAFNEHRMFAGKS